MRRGREQRGAGPRGERVRGVVLEIRGRARPRYFERRGGPRPSGEPLPVDSRLGVPRVERTRDCVGDETLPVRSGEGRPEGGTERGPRETPEGGPAGPL